MKVIFNTSFIIQEEIETEWIDFMKTQYIPSIRKEKKCKDILFTKVSIDQPEGKTYSLQLIFDSETAQNQFLELVLPTIGENLIRRYHNKYLFFNSTLTEI